MEEWLGFSGGTRLHASGIDHRAVGWLPLVLLTAIRGDLVRSDTANSFILDFGVQARFLFAAPLLVLAEAVCVPRLAALAQQFIDSGMVAQPERFRYDATVGSSQRLMNSRVIEIALIGLAYALVFALVKAAPPEMIPSWHGRLNPFAATPAGWWVRSSSSPWRSVQQSL